MRANDVKLYEAKPPVAQISVLGFTDLSDTLQDEANIEAITNAAMDAGHVVVIPSGTEARVTVTVKNTLTRLAGNHSRSNWTKKPGLAQENADGGLHLLYFMNVITFVRLRII